MAKKDLIIDPEFEALIPPLTADEYAALEDNLRRHGCQQALVVWKGTLVDGHNRYKICKKFDIPFRTKPLAFIDTRESVLTWMIDNQLARRSINDFQRAELVLKKKDALAALAKAKQNEGVNQYSSLSTNLSKGSTLDTRRELAKAAGVSEGTIAKVEKIKENAVESVLSKARSGEVKIDVAAQVASLPKEEQVALAAAGKDALKAAAKEVRQASKQKQSAAREAVPEAKEGINDPKPQATSPLDDDDELDRLRVENATLRNRVEELTAASKNTEIEIQLAEAQAEVQRLTDVCQELNSRIEALKEENNFLAKRRNVQDQTDHEPEFAEVNVENCSEVLVEQPANDAVVVDVPSPVTLDASVEPNASITIGENINIDASDKQRAAEGTC